MSKFNKAPLAGLVAMVLASSAAVAGKPLPPPASVAGSYSVDAVNGVTPSLVASGLPTVKGRNSSPIDVTVDFGSFEITSRYMCAVQSYRQNGNISGTKYEEPAAGTNSATGGANDPAATMVATTTGVVKWSGEAYLAPEVLADCSAYNTTYQNGKPKTAGNAVLCEVSVTEASVSATYEEKVGSVIELRSLTGSAPAVSLNLCK